MVGIGAPVALIGVIVAVLVLASRPWARSRRRAAIVATHGQHRARLRAGNHRVDNPAVLTLGVFRGTPIILGLGQQEMMLLALTLVCQC